MYFYHPDHLGSSSLITNADGIVTQHVEYVPYGEVFIEERNSTWNTPYLFNAKELDEETGLYYYGARYYDPKTSVWISSDPLKELYPNASSYLFCNANPVRYVDPTGMNWYEHRNSNGKSSYIWQEGNKSTITINNQEYTDAGQYHTSTTSDGSVSVFYNQNNIIGVLDRESTETTSSSTGLGLIGVSLNFSGVAASKLEYSNVVNGMWLGMNKKWNSLNWGGNGSTRARSIATKKAGVYRSVGRGAFYLSTTISLYQAGAEIIDDNPSGALKPGLDMLMGGVATFGGPPGMVAGGIYYTFDALGAFKGSPMLSVPIIDKTIIINDNTHVEPSIVIPKNILRVNPQFYLTPSK